MKWSSKNGIMIELLVDIVLMKLNMFQGKRKVKDRWSEVEYVVIHQVTSDMPTYKVKDDGGNVKFAHHNRLFLVAPVKETATPLGRGESISYVSTTRSGLVELTSLECNGEMPESEVESTLTSASPVMFHLDGWMVFYGHYHQWL